MEEMPMRRLLVPPAALLIASYGVIAAAGDLKSGLQVGDQAGAYKVKDCTGPGKDSKPLCYR